MNISTICFIVFIALISTIALLRIYRMRTPQMQVARYRSQTMCLACGSITAQSEANCLQCGKPLRSA